MYIPSPTMTPCNSDLDFNQVPLSHPVSECRTQLEELETGDIDGSPGSLGDCAAPVSGKQPLKLSTGLPQDRTALSKSKSDWVCPDLVSKRAVARCTKPCRIRLRSPSQTVAGPAAYPLSTDIVCP